MRQQISSIPSADSLSWDGADFLAMIATPLGSCAVLRVIPVLGCKKARGTVVVLAGELAVARGRFGDSFDLDQQKSLAMRTLCAIL